LVPSRRRTILPDLSFLYLRFPESKRISSLLPKARFLDLDGFGDFGVNGYVLHSNKLDPDDSVLHVAESLLVFWFTGKWNLLPHS
jgi:hypothetical protein